jgi:hypothetical protein
MSRSGDTNVQFFYFCNVSGKKWHSRVVVDSFKNFRQCLYSSNFEGPKPGGTHDTINYGFKCDP